MMHIEKLEKLLHETIVKYVRENNHEKLVVNLISDYDKGTIKIKVHED